MSNISSNCSAHNEFRFDNILFSSNFDNGNLANVEKSTSGSISNSYKVWSAPDNYKSQYQSRNSFWFHFSITGLESGEKLSIRLVNAANHATLYKHDMRPVYKSFATNNVWTRLKKPVRFEKGSDGLHIVFDHTIEAFPSYNSHNNDIINSGRTNNATNMNSDINNSVSVCTTNNINYSNNSTIATQSMNPNSVVYFAFTFPYTYTMVMKDLEPLSHWKVGNRKVLEKSLQGS